MRQKRDGRLRLHAAVAVAVHGFRRYATYRVATAAGVFTNTVFGFIISYTYIALWDQRPRLGGRDQSQALTYAWVGQALFAAMAISGGGAETELMERIRSGDIAVDLYRPTDLQMWWLATDLGRTGFQLLGRGVVPWLCGALAFDLALPSSPLTWLLFQAALVLGAVTGFALRYLVAQRRTGSPTGRRPKGRRGRRADRARRRGEGLRRTPQDRVPAA